MSKGYFERDFQLIEKALEYYEDSKAQDSEPLFLLAIQTLMDGLGLLPTHKAELMNIVRGEYGDPTPALAAKFGLELEKRCPSYPDNLDRQELIHEMIDEVQRRWEQSKRR